MYLYSQVDGLHYRYKWYFLKYATKLKKKKPKTSDTCRTVLTDLSQNCWQIHCSYLSSLKFEQLASIRLQSINPFYV